MNETNSTKSNPPLFNKEYKLKKEIVNFLQEEVGSSTFYNFKELKKQYFNQLEESEDDYVESFRIFKSIIGKITTVMALNKKYGIGSEFLSDFAFQELSWRLLVERIHTTINDIKKVIKKYPHKIQESHIYKLMTHIFYTFTFDNIHGEHKKFQENFIEAYKQYFKSDTNWMYLLFNPKGEAFTYYQTLKIPTFEEANDDSRLVHPYLHSERFKYLWDWRVEILFHLYILSDDFNIDPIVYYNMLQFNRDARDAFFHLILWLWKWKEWEQKRLEDHRPSTSLQRFCVDIANFANKQNDGTTTIIHNYSDFTTVKDNAKKYFQ